LLLFCIQAELSLLSAHQKISLLRANQILLREDLQDAAPEGSQDPALAALLSWKEYHAPRDCIDAEEAEKVEASDEALQGVIHEAAEPDTEDAMQLAHDAIDAGEACIEAVEGTSGHTSEPLCQSNSWIVEEVPSGGKQEAAEGVECSTNRNAP